MDKASIIRDAIAYIEHLQEQERRLLAETCALGLSTSASAVKTEYAATGQAADGANSFPWRKKPRSVPDGGGTRGSVPTSPPVQILEVINSLQSQVADTNFQPTSYWRYVRTRVQGSRVIN